jgi:H+/Cl- antiporter ClcA
MTARLPRQEEPRSWVLALVPVIVVVVFVFWVNTTIHPQSGWLPSDPRREPSHMLASILLGLFFAALGTVQGFFFLLSRFWRERAE